MIADYAPIPPSLGFTEAAGLPVAVETATRGLDALGFGAASTLLVNGAAGGVGSTAVQLAVARGARVIGTASPVNHDYLRTLGAEPVAYGEGLVERVRALAPDGVDAALDVAGSGVLPELIELAGGPEHVVTLADFAGAREHGVTFSSGDAGRAVHALAEIGELIESGASRSRSHRLSRSPRSRRRIASVRTVTRAGSSCCWLAGSSDRPRPFIRHQMCTARWTTRTIPESSATGRRAWAAAALWLAAAPVQDAWRDHVQGDEEEHEV